MKEIFKIVVFSFVALTLKAQSIDKVEAIIGDEIVLRSDIESQYLQYLSQGNIKSEAVKCEIIDECQFCGAMVVIVFTHITFIEFFGFVTIFRAE